MSPRQDESEKSSKISFLSGNLKDIIVISIYLVTAAYFIGSQTQIVSHHEASLKQLSLQANEIQAKLQTLEIKIQIMDNLKNDLDWLRRYTTERLKNSP